MDWDISLVSQETGDTCWWRNPRMATQPLYTYAKYLPGRALPQGYTSDTIQSENIAPGRYSVFVHFYQGYADTATPMLNFELGFTPQNQIVNFASRMSPALPMRKSQVWHAADIQIPEMQIFRADTIALGTAKVLRTW